MHAGKRKIAVELESVIVRGGARRQDFDHNDRVWDLHRVEVGRGRADDERVGLERVARVHSHGHAVRKNAAWEAGADNTSLQRLLGRVFVKRVGSPLRRHHDRLAVAQLPAASRPSAQTRNASTSISFFAGLDMRNPTMAGNG